VILNTLRLNCKVHLQNNLWGYNNDMFNCGCSKDRLSQTYLFDNNVLKDIGNQLRDFLRVVT